jgi:hypothetical protein
VTGVAQLPIKSYDRIEIPEIELAGLIRTVG